jgi:hypothetical protein
MVPVPPFHASLDLARRVDLAEIRFCALAARAGQDGGASALEVGGGMALCGVPGSPFNKVLGLGLGVSVSDADLDAIDVFYDERGVASQIELCPLATQGLAPRLAARGYALQGFENQLALVLDGTDHAPTSLPPSIGALTVAPASTADDEERWIDVVAQGFGAAVEMAAHDVAIAQGDLQDVARSFQHEDQVRYLVREDGRPIGAGAAWFIDGVVGLTGTATLPPHRGRGAQHAVVARMLRDAAGRADLAMATVEPGSQSQRAFERFGFRVIYTRAVFLRPFK